MLKTQLSIVGSGDLRRTIKEIPVNEVFSYNAEMVRKVVICGRSRDVLPELDVAYLTTEKGRFFVLKDSNIEDYRAIPTDRLGDLSVGAFFKYNECLHVKVSKDASYHFTAQRTRFYDDELNVQLVDKCDIAYQVI
jgi:hypothetical protein